MTSGSSTRPTTAATTTSSATSSGATTPSACTCTSAFAAPTGRSRCTNGLRNLLPEILALSASSPFVESVNTGLHSARTQIFTRFFLAGVPDAFASWQQYEDYVRFLYETGSVTEHTQLCGVFDLTSVSRRSRSGLRTASPDLGEAQALAAFGYALAAGSRGRTMRVSRPRISRTA